MSDDQRVYSDAEFALILRKAAELANPRETPGHPSGGLTLTEMKAAASEAGIDPALVERAARLLPASSSSSLFERLIGGPLRHEREIHYPVRMDEARAAQLLAAIQIGAGEPGNGHSSSVGVVWDAKDETEALRVTAQPDEGGTSIAIHVDRRGTMAITGVVSLLGCMIPWLGGSVLSAEVSLPLGVATIVGGMGGVLAVGRGYWASSTKRVRERINSLTDAIGQVIAQPESRPSSSGDAPVERSSEQASG